MAKKINAQVSAGFPWRYVFMAAGLAIVAPYFVRRVLPLLQGDMVNTSADDVALAGKDAVRDAADDLNVGGLGGKIERGVGRVADRLDH